MRVNERLVEALELSEKLLLAGPNDIRFRAEQIKHFYEVRLYAEAVAAAEELRQIMPGYSDFSEAAALHKLGRFRESYFSRLAAYRLLGEKGQTRRNCLESGFEQDGYPGAMRALWQQQLSESKQTGGGLVPHERLIMVDSENRQLRDLERELHEHRAWVIGFVHDPDYDDLRVFGEFDTLIDRMNLPKTIASAAKRADIARVRLFNGQARQALHELLEIIETNPNDQRMPRWKESAAWAHFFLGEHDKVHELTRCIKDAYKSRSQEVYANLLDAASWSLEGEMDKARIALLKAIDLWLGELDYDLDLHPLFQTAEVAFSKVLS